MKKAIFFIIFVLGIPVTHSWAINTSDYIPLNSGDSWTYLEDGYKTITNYVLPGTFYVNGYPTKITASSVDSTQIYSSNDINGLRRHKETGAINVNGTNYNYTVIFSPAMLSEPS